MESSELAASLLVGPIDTSVSPPADSSSTYSNANHPTIPTPATVAGYGQRRRRHQTASAESSQPLLPRAVREQTGVGSLGLHMAVAAGRQPRTGSTRRLQPGGSGRPAHSHTALYRLLSHRSHACGARAFNFVLLAVIIGNVLAFTIATIPGVGHESVFYTIEAASSGFFLIEYVLRVIVAPEEPKYRSLSPTRARLCYVITARALVDAAATFPFFVELAVGYELPNTTVLRVLRVFRILKTEKATRALSSIYRVLWYNAEILSVGMLLAMLLIFITAMLLYYLRPRDGESAEFESLPATLYLALLMLCGQGEPEGPLPWYTQAVVASTACVSIAFFAIPASMLTWGFEAEAERLFNKAVERRRRMQRAKAEGRVMSDSESSEDEEEEEDEEAEWRGYEEVVVGSDGNDDDGSRTAAERRAQAERKAQALAAELFQACDVDGSGELALDEVAAYLTDHLLRDREIDLRTLERAKAADNTVGVVHVDDAATSGDMGVVVERLGRLETAVAAQAAAFARLEVALLRGRE